MLPIYQYEARLRNQPVDPEEEQDLEPMGPDEKITLDKLPAITKAIYSGDPNQELIACQLTWKLTCLPRPKPAIDDIITIGVVTKCIELLKCSTTSTEARLEVAGILTNIAAKTPMHVKRIVELGAVDSLIETLHAESQYFQLELVSARALGKIASESYYHRILILNTPSALPRLIQLAMMANSRVPKGDICWALLNLCRGGKDQPIPQNAVHQMLPALAQLMNNCRSGCRTGACWALEHLTRWTREAITQILNFEGLVAELIGQIGLEYGTIPCLLTIGNIIAGGNEEEAQQVLNAGPLIAKLCGIMMTRHSATVKNSAWVISKIVTGTNNGVSQVIDRGLVPLLVQAYQIFQNQDEKTRNEAVYAITAIANSCAQDQIEDLCEGGVMPVICSAFKFKCTDGCYNDKVLVGLHALSKILIHAHANKSASAEEHDGGSDKLRKYRQEIVDCGGLASLEQLQLDHDKHVNKRDNNDLYKVARAILDNFFREDDDEDVKPAKVQKID